MILPVGKQAHAVACAENLVEVVLQHVEGQVQVNGLRHIVRRLKLERDMRDHAQRAQTHHRTEEGVAVFLARELRNLAFGGHDFKACNRRGQVAVVQARAVRGRGNGAGHGDVRQRGQIVQRVAL